MMKPMTFLSIGHAVFWNQPTTADAAALMPFHAHCTMLRNVSEFLYARMIPAMSAAMAMTTSPIGLSAMTMLSAAWTMVHTLIAPTRTAMPAARGSSQSTFFPIHSAMLWIAGMRVVMANEASAM